MCAADARAIFGAREHIKEIAMSDKQTGTVKWFSEAKGFGFITPVNGGEDLFAHFKEIQGGANFKSLSEGQKVEFIPLRGPKGMQATRIQPIS
jgi:CspA family cold shock protein